MDHDQSGVITFTRSELYEKIWNTPSETISAPIQCPTRFLARREISL
jgi:hypothetical protein